MKEIFTRAREIILKPRETWQVIKAETVSVQDLFINYAAPLALVPAVAALIGLSVVGIRMPAGHIARAPFMEALVGSVLGYVFGLLGLLAGAWAVNFLAPYFDSKADFNAAIKLVVFSMTPIWLVGVFSVLPGLGLLQIFGVYGIYLLYLGLPILMETSPEKAFWYTALIVIGAILISLVLNILVGGAFYGPMFMRMLAL